MLPDRNTRASPLGPAVRGDPALCQHPFWFLEHPEMYSQDLESFQYTSCSTFIVLATLMALCLKNSIIFSMKESQFGCITRSTGTFRNSSK